MEGAVAMRRAQFVRRTCIFAGAAAAMVALVGYLLVTNYRSALNVRENLLAQRSQHVQSHAVAVGHLFASAAEDIRYLAESREVAAFYESRDLGMSMEYGLALSLVPIHDRLKALVQPKSAPSKFARVAILDEKGDILADSEDGEPAWDRQERRLAATGKAVLTAEGHHLSIAWPHSFKGRQVALFLAWLRPDSVLDALSRQQGASSFFILDSDGRPYAPAGVESPVLPAVVDGIPADGHMVEVRSAEHARGERATTYLAARVPIPGQNLSLVQFDRADLLGELSPIASALHLAFAACVVLAMLSLAIVLNMRALILQARLDESLRREQEVGEKHAALQREVSERRRLEAAHAILTMAIDHAAEAIAVTDERGAVEYSNAAFQRLAKCSTDAARGLSVADALAQHAGTPHAADLSDAFTGTAPWRGELSGQRADGSSFDIELVTSPVHDDAGGVVNHVLVVRDVTEEKRLREQLRHSQKLEAIGTLAGGVAHDFRNLLTVMKANAEFCLGALPEDHPVRGDIQEVLQAVGRAADLTRQLLAFGRRQVLNPEVLDVNVVVADIEKMLRRLIGENVQLRTTPSRVLSHVRVDRGQLEQVLVNLVVNARDAMPNGGRLTISTDQVRLSDAEARRQGAPSGGRYVKLSVSDTGVGMDAHTLRRVFEPFFTTKPHGKGTGLGLATVYGIVQQSRGFVTASSTLTQGATFDVYLPADEEELLLTAPAIACASREERSGRADETILVVEDEEQVRSALQRQLSAEGYSVLTAPDGRAASAMIEQFPQRIDLLLSDVVMPHLGGPELARKFRVRHPDAAVILMSGYSDEAVARHGALNPDAAFIEKPYDYSELARLLRRLLDRATPNPTTTLAMA
jgi:PAS domain S-box-containing protein